LPTLFLAKENNLREQVIEYSHYVIKTWVILQLKPNFIPPYNLLQYVIEEALGFKYIVCPFDCQLILLL